MPNAWERVPFSNPLGFKHHRLQGAGRKPLNMRSRHRTSRRHCLEHLACRLLSIARWGGKHQGDIKSISSNNQCLEEKHVVYMLCEHISKHLSMYIHTVYYLPM